MLHSKTYLGARGPLAARATHPFRVDRASPESGQLALQLAA